MRTAWLLVACLGPFLLAEPLQAGEAIALKVLYAGNPGSDREKDFTAFLQKSFGKVGTADYRSFKESDAKDYDVVIFDWTTIFPTDDQGKIKQPISRLNSPKAPTLSNTFDRPAILIGAAGGFLTMQAKLKIDWL
jgi:hypothetical protein